MIPASIAAGIARLTAENARLRTADLATIVRTSPEAARELRDMLAAPSDGFRIPAGWACWANVTGGLWPYHQPCDSQAHGLQLVTAALTSDERRQWVADLTDPNGEARTDYAAWLAARVTEGGAK